MYGREFYEGIGGGEVGEIGGTAAGQGMSQKLSVSGGFDASRGEIGQFRFEGNGLGELHKQRRVGGGTHRPLQIGSHVAVEAH